MASNIDPSNIDGTYPLEGVNNDSQGFRTNFTNTSANLSAAKTEIEELQDKVILKEALIGEAADNTLTIPLNTVASTSSVAGFNVPEGIAPTSPIDGDVWVTATGEFYARLNGVTVDLSAGGTGGGIPDGGTTGQILVKQSATDGDADWQNSNAPTSSASSYCPGYTYSFVNASQFDAIGGDYTRLLSSGRYIKFIEGATETYGTITSSTFTGGNTRVTMNMDSDPLTVGVTEFCLVTGAADWSPIAGDPFAGSSINNITSGFIGATKYWIAVGDGGKIFYSTDIGVTWSAATAATTENLNQVAYNPDSQTFIACGENAVLCRSTNGTTFTVDTAQVLAAITDGPGHVIGIGYDEDIPDNWKIIMQYLAAGNIGTSYSTDDGLTWSSATNVGALVTTTGVRDAKLQNYTTAAGSWAGFMMSFGEDVYFAGNATTAFSLLVNFSSTGNSMAIHSAYATSGSQTVIGKEDGDLYRGTGIEDQSIMGGDIIRDWASSVVQDIIIGVGDNGKILRRTRDMFDPEDWVLIPNNSNPLANFTTVHFDSGDGFWIAANDQGQILRSSNGGTPAGISLEYSGWTAIAADPFSGGNISHIATGAIGASQWWVAVGGTSLFTSVDAGVTWTSRAAGTSGTFVGVAYDSTNQKFVAYCNNGDFTSTTNGSTWTADTTTIAAIGGPGSNRINAMVWDPAGGLWQAAIEFNITSIATFSTDSTLVTWVQREGSAATNTGYPALVTYDNGIVGRRIFHAGISSPVFWNDPTDTVPSTLVAMTEVATAIFAKTGTLGSATDLYIGDSAGDIQFYDSGSRLNELGVMVGPVNGFAFSSVANRMVAVGNGGEIKTKAGSDLETPNTWYNVVTPFSGNINAVAYNATDDIFICVCSDGVIARSTDGIS
jgi:hypothetical protein